jgi:hypothetical protein
VKHLVSDTAAIEHCICGQDDSVGEGIPITAYRLSSRGIVQGQIRLEPGDGIE